MRVRLEVCEVISEVKGVRVAVIVHEKCLKHGPPCFELCGDVTTGLRHHEKGGLREDRVRGFGGSGVRGSGVRELGGN